MDAEHECKRPISNSFLDGRDADGCWIEDGLHWEQIAGSSGIYLIATDVKTGEVIRDDRPWQMTS